MGKGYKFYKTISFLKFHLLLTLDLVLVVSLPSASSPRIGLLKTVFPISSAYAANVSLAMLGVIFYNWTGFARDITSPNSKQAHLKRL
jgi:hypothetical protein